MNLFIPEILTVTPIAGIEAQSRRVVAHEDIRLPAGSEFQKVYFEELVKRCYAEEGSFESLASVARIHHEEYFGVGGTAVKRWKIHFLRYNISLNLEESGGKLVVKAA